MGDAAPGRLTPRLVVDTGGLIALERNDARAYEQLRTASGRGILVVVPTSVYLEASMGARHPAPLEQVLRAIRKELPLEPAISHQVALLRRKAIAESGNATISETDAIVVLEALAVPGSLILTDDREDSVALLAAAGARGRVAVLTVSPVRDKAARRVR